MWGSLAADIIFNVANVDQVGFFFLWGSLAADIVFDVASVDEVCVSSC
jgi:hypothetical protein